MSHKYAVVGIGNAIVDVLCQVEENFIAEQGLPKGGMTLIDETRAEQIYAGMGVATECSGGSAANTLAGMAMLGSKAAFIGKVRDDQLGKIFTHDLNATGVDFTTQAATQGPATARCYVAVTPDGERTMATFLGVASHVNDMDMETATIEAAKILYIEGYLWDAPETIQALEAAIQKALHAETKVAFTLSDAFCVERHRDAFKALIENQLDILFANDAEIKALFETDDFHAAMQQLQGQVEVAAITCGADGAYVVTGDAISHVPTSAIEQMTDATGAGDLFAAGFLHGYAQGIALEEAATLGNQCAGEIIQQMGARASNALKQLVA